MKPLKVPTTFLKSCIEQRLCRLVLVVVWTMLVGVSLQLSIQAIERASMSMATESARKMFSMVELTRLWNARHGGVYVPISERAQPNPYLKVPNREIHTINGKDYTMINPAYMTRQIAELAKAENVTFHITSLKPIRPGNAPDSWEQKALESFERDVKETSSLLTIDDNQVFRYMAPLKVKKACMKCHEEQGYQVGDIRGGISVTMPSAHLFNIQNRQIWQTTLQHLVTYVLVMVMLLYFLSFMRRQLSAQRSSEQEHVKIIEELKQELIEENELLQKENLRQKETSEVLRKSEAQYRHIIEPLRQDYFFYSYDNQGRPTYFSPSVANVLGYDAEQMMENYEDYWASNPDILSADRFREQGQEHPTKYEVEIAHRDGSTRIIELNEQPLRDAEGKLTSVEGIAHDRTVRKLNEERFQLDEARLQAQLNLALLEVDSERQLIDYALEESVRLTKSQGGYLHFFDEDENTIQLYAWSGEVMKLCTTVEDEHYPLDKAGVWADCIRQGGPVIHNDYPGLSYKKGLPEGHFPLQRHMSVPILDGTRVVGIAGVGNKEKAYSDADTHTMSSFMNIMWRLLKSVRAEIEVDQLRKYLQNILDSMPSVMVGIDLNANVVHWNLEAERTTGLDAQYAEGKGVDIVLPILREEMHEIKKAIEEKRSFRKERVSHSIKGERRFADIMIYPLITNAEVGAVVRLDDITDRVRIEEMMVQTEKMLSVGGLAAGMAHEINNPLGGILQGQQNIRRRLDESLDKNREIADALGLDLAKLHAYLDQREVLYFLDNIAEAGKRASDIVDNMLEFSRKGGVEKKPVDLAALIKRVGDLAAVDYDLKKQYDFRSIHIKHEFDPGLPKVPCVATEIQQVFLNILRNSAQAIQSQEDREEPGEIIIRMQMGPGVLQIEIQDDGPGMDEETRKRIFEPFFTTKPPGLGTGLGMSVSYFIIVDSHGGRMQVDSTPGKGTRVIIELPL